MTTGWCRESKKAGNYSSTEVPTYYYNISVVGKYLHIFKLKHSARVKKITK